KGSNAKKVYSGPEYQNLDIYQINCTYYSALSSNDDAYIAARAIQFFSPGIPQVYYVGLLAGENDTELLEQTRNGRDINRHNYSVEEIEEEFKRPVVQRLVKLMEFRSNHPAFQGNFTIAETPEDQLGLTWEHAGHYAALHVDLRSYRAELRHTDLTSGEEVLLVL
ncbi:MAG: sucrose phosphorylase, partial [Verrucomicrobiota bacterium]|nr:sucrose phosphorylase [Verrucomicrobiota bacterium]